MEFDKTLFGAGQSHIRTPTCSCHSWLLTGPNSFQASPVDNPAQTPDGRVKLRLLRCGHCESDAGVAEKGRHPSQKGASAGILLGHEPIGEVIQIGSAVSNLRVGQIVAVEPGISCGTCTECRRGRYNLCRTVKYLATPGDGWYEGAYKKEMFWPATQCYAVPQGLDLDVAALAESSAASKESVDYVATTTAFHPEEEAVVLLGAGQMAMNILLQLKRRWPSLTVIVMARKKSDRDLAENLGADYTLPLAQQPFKSESLEGVVGAAQGEGATLCDVQAKVQTYLENKAHNALIHQENILAFKEARKMAGEQVACVLECTGQAHILNAAFEARTIRGDGSYGLVSCLYNMSLDVANLRRDAARVWNLRRSRNQFVPVLKELARNPGYYKQLVGHLVDFDNIPLLYQGDKGKKVGEGPKVVIRYDS